MGRFQILSLIGGGIRGAFVTAFLDRLEQKHGRSIAESFDLIAGTSTGGIIAAGLALGKSAAEMHDFYVRYGAKIFTPRDKYKGKGVWRFLYPPANYFFKKKTGGNLDAAFRARFCPHALQTSFDEGFGDLTLGDANFTRLIIPSFNLTAGVPHVFRSSHLPKGVHDRDLKISDIVIAATAAPTYFPHRVVDGQAFIDGGVWASDPSMLAFAEAMRIQQFDDSVDVGTCESNDVHLLSIGTGQAQFTLSPPGADAGLLYWAPRVADVMGTSQVQGIHLPMKFLLGDRYSHINFKMKEKWPLDGIENIPDLFDVGKKRAEHAYGMINQRYLAHKRAPFRRFEEATGEVQLDEFGFE